MTILHSARRYGDSLNYYDLLKLLALVSMVIDHIGYFLLPEVTVLRALGRYAFPVFLFLVGYSGNWKIKPDIIVLAVFMAVVSWLTKHPVFPLNILVSIIVTRLIMQRFMESEGEVVSMKLMNLTVASLLFFIFSIYAVEYGTLNILFALCGLLKRQHPDSRITAWFIAATLVLHAVLLQTLAFSFPPLSALVMVAVLLAAGWQIMHFSVREVNTDRIASGLRVALQWAAHNTLLLFAAHVAVLMVVEYVWFPEHLVDRPTLYVTPHAK